MFSGPAPAIRLTSGTAAMAAQPGPASGTIARCDMLACAVSGRAVGEMGGGAGNHDQHERNLRLGSSQMLSKKRAPRNDHFPRPGSVGANQGNSTPHDCRPPGGPGGPGVLPGAGGC